ncbi:MAG: DUF4097 family beta strand repeat protein [Phycisphaerales bacterium]|nr:MAG: DUF4097 family beta strand repeat protein [Phycisphaerales bacterium]
MNKHNRIIPALVFCWFLACCGCDIQIGHWSQARYDRTVQRQEPLAPGSTLVARTSLGSVTITGADVVDCSVVAEITGRAPTEEEAQELAEKVEIELETVGNTLTVKAHKPSTKHNRSVSISYTIIVPKRTHIECSSSYGAIELSDIGGNVRGKTSSGSISAENIEGVVKLDTSYGTVTCTNVSGQSVAVKTSSGTITAERIKGSTELNTSYGPISCTGFSAGDLKLKSSSGKIRLTNASFGDCDAHTSYGSIDAEELEGDLIKLHSDSGSIEVANASADTADLSTSYGRIKGRQITANELTAKSGSGNLDIACSAAAPPDITATLVTSYGSIDFTAPLDFAGQADLSTSYGSITTDRPITVSGEISKKRLKGTIGEGNGKLHLQTSSGSIKLKQQTK